MLSLEDVFGFRPRRILVYGGGGGGDVVSAAVLAEALRRDGVDAIVGGIGWERFVVDPVPGPIRMDEYTNVIHCGEYFVVVSGETRARRGNRTIFPQVARVASVIGRGVVVIDLWRGVEGYYKGLLEVSHYYGIDGFILVDVGGDILATGCEDELWSPLADVMSLAAFSKLEHSVTAVHSIGSDGELPQDYIIERISAIAREGGLLGARGLTRNDSLLLEKILNSVVSEASRIPLLAFKGFHGRLDIRLGTRRVNVTPIHTITFLLDTRILYKNSPLARLVDGTKDLVEAKRRLNEHGIYTEMDLEEDLLRARAMDPRKIIEVRTRRLLELRSRRERFCSLIG